MVDELQQDVHGGRGILRTGARTALFRVLQSQDIVDNSFEAVWRGTFDYTGMAFRVSISYFELYSMARRLRRSATKWGAHPFLRVTLHHLSSVLGVNISFFVAFCSFSRSVETHK